MTLMEKEILEQPKVLASLYAANEITVNNLVSDIKQRDIRLVYFAARGTSDHASIYASYLISTLVGVPTALALPSVVTAYNGKLNLKDALVIGVSQSGKAADVLAVMERAKENGALTVAVTNDLQSPMATYGDYHLYCNAGLESSVAATKTFTSQMYVMAMLAAAWSGSDKLKNALERVPEAIEQELSYIPEQIERVISRYRYMEHGFVLSRGTTMAIAFETMLKLQETNYVKMKGYAVSDFWHGPLAQVDEGTFVILYAPKGVVFDNCKEMLAKLDSIGAEVVLVTDDEDLAKDRRFAFVLPELGTDMASPFLFAVFAQMFACRLTAVKGRNPDAPRNLNKVTITK
ncbi:MAG: SIS domain-containing protein [Clostridia bacterium]